MIQEIVEGLGGPEELASLEKRLADLVLLGGKPKIAGMLGHLAGHLRALLAASPEELDRMNLHRIVGLAGILGFTVVDRTWRAVEEDGSGSAELTTARRAAEAAVLFIEGWASRPAE